MFVGVGSSPKFDSWSISSDSDAFVNNFIRCKSRSCISLAAALEKVKQSIRSGFAQCSNNRMILSIRTLVFPEPADALTQQLELGLLAFCCRLIVDTDVSFIAQH